MHLKFQSESRYTIHISSIQ